MIWFLFPQSVPQIGMFYAAWAALFVTIYILVFVFTRKQGEKFADGLSYPLGAAAVSFSNSLLMLLSVFNETTFALVFGSFNVTIILAGVTGILVSIKALMRTQ
jgi:hypothetical protein